MHETEVPLVQVFSDSEFGQVERNDYCKPVCCNGCCCLVTSAIVAVFLLILCVSSFYYMPRSAEFQSVTLVTDTINITRHIDEIYINTTCSVELEVRNNLLVNLVQEQGEVALSFLDTNGLEVLAAYMTVPHSMKVPADKLLSIPFDLIASNVGNNLWEIAAADVLAAKARLRLWGHVLLHDHFLFRIRAYVSCWLDMKVDYVLLPEDDFSVYLSRPPDEIRQCKADTVNCEIWFNPFPTIHAKATVMKQECEYGSDFPNFILKNHVSI